MKKIKTLMLVLLSVLLLNIHITTFEIHGEEDASFNYEFVGGKKFAFVWETNKKGETVKRYVQGVKNEELSGNGDKCVPVKQ